MNITRAARETKRLLDEGCVLVREDGLVKLVKDTSFENPYRYISTEHGLKNKPMLGAFIHVRSRFIIHNRKVKW